ncbi:hypothetical protein QUB75_04510 [Microcoleus sp. K1-B6]
MADCCVAIAGLETIALELLKLLKLPVVMTLGELWCLEVIGQEYNQFD